MDGFHLNVRTTFRRHPRACRAAPRSLTCTAKESQAESWVKKMMLESVHQRFDLALVCRASQVAAEASNAFAVAAKRSHTQQRSEFEPSGQTSITNMLKRCWCSVLRESLMFSCDMTREG